MSLRFLCKSVHPVTELDPLRPSQNKLQPNRVLCLPF